MSRKLRENDGGLVLSNSRLIDEGENVKMKSYQKVETPADVQAKALEAIEGATKSGKIRKGTNEATKAVERGDAKLVAIAGDVDPEEIVMHLPTLCEEKKVPYVFISEKKSLGKAAGLAVGTAAIAVSGAGAGEDALKEVLSKIGVKSEKPEAKEEKAAKPKKKE